MLNGKGYLRKYKKILEKAQIRLGNLLITNATISLIRKSIEKFFLKHDIV